MKREFTRPLGANRSGKQNHRASGPLRVVDFFCGAGGMSYGLQKAGLQIIAGIDADVDCERTYTANLRGAKYLREDISTLSLKDLAGRLGIKKGDGRLVFAGCSPCQFWSKINTDRTKGRQTAFLLKHFQRFVAGFKPGYVVIENVPGLLTRKGHSILPVFLEFLTASGYTWADSIVDASQFGVPQHRRRYLLVATRLAGVVPTLPNPIAREPITVRASLAEYRGLKRLAAGECDRADALHRAAALSDENLRRLQKTPVDGGDRRSWKDTDLQISAYDGKDGIFKDVYGRMFWDRPAPTITTRFNSLSNGRFGHPDQDRAISLREGAILQTFPKVFRFIGSSQGSIARQIGNAVPPALAKKIGLHLLTLSSNG